MQNTFVDNFGKQVNNTKTNFYVQNSLFIKVLYHLYFLNVCFSYAVYIIRLYSYCSLKCWHVQILLEIRASTYISAKLKKNVPICTIHCIFQLKWTLEAANSDNFFPFHTKYDLGTVLIDKGEFSHNYLQNVMLWLHNNFNILHDLKTDTFEHCRHMLHMYEFLIQYLYSVAHAIRVGLRWWRAPVRIPSN